MEIRFFLKQSSRVAGFGFLSVALITTQMVAMSNHAPSWTRDGDTPAGPLQQSENVELVGQLGGATGAVAVDGRYAYVGVGTRLVVLDVSDPRNPLTVGQTAVMPDVVADIAVAGDLAYVANGNGGLRIIDVTTPASPREIGVVDTLGYSADLVAIAGGLAYVKCSSSGGIEFTNNLWLIDVTLPTSPRRSAVFDASSDIVSDIAVAGRLAYLAAGSGLRVIDATVLSNPREVGSLPMPGIAYGVAVAGDYALVTVGDSSLRVIDVTVPANLREVGDLPMPGFADKIAVSNGYAYVADGSESSGLRVIDVTPPSDPREVGFVPTAEAASDVVVADGIAYLERGSGLLVIDVARPASPRALGSYATLGDAGHAVVAGDHAYVADWDDGLRVVDVSAPANPREVGFVPTLNGAWDVAVEGDYAYVIAHGPLAGIESLRVIDVSTATNPNEVGSLGLYWAEGIAVANGYAFIAGRSASAGLQVIDVTPPTDLRELGSLPTTSDAWDIAVSGSLAYLAAGDDGLWVIDVAAPNSPRQVGFIPGVAKGVAVTGRYAYVAGGDDGLRVIDVAAPTNPRQVGSLPTQGSVGDVAVTGDHAFVLVENQGVWAVDVTVPSNPREAGYFLTYRTFGSARSIAAAGGVAYLAGPDLGFLALRLRPPATPTPTATSTRIATPSPTRTSSSTAPATADHPGSCGTPEALVLPTTFSASIATSADLDVFAFDVPTPFTQIDLAITDPGDDLDVILYHDCDPAIGPASGRHIGASSGRHIGGGRRRLVYDVLLQTGRYYIQAQPREEKKASLSYPRPYTLDVKLVAPNPTAIRTLILTHRDRVVRGSGDSPADVAAWWGALERLAGQPGINGRIVENVQTRTNAAVAVAYQEWLHDPTGLDATAKANAVAVAIHDWVWEARDYLPNLQYIVIAGDDRVIPHLRIGIEPTGGLDTNWRDEATYLDTERANIAVRSTIGSALSDNQTLTDDLYGAKESATRRRPELAHTTDLFVPELAVGRLVESPRDMTAVISAYVQSGGELPLRNSLAAGWDVMVDGIADGDAHLEAVGLTSGDRRRLMANACQLSPLKSQLLDRRNDMALLGLHGWHYQLQTADNAYLHARDIATAPADLTGSFVFGMACHAGLNLPGTEHGESLDLPEAWLRKGATYISSTGWAYAGEVGLDYQERLMHEFLRDLLGGSGKSVGDALVDAKRRYYEQHDMTAMHAKTLAGTILYGLPMARVKPSGSGSKLPWPQPIPQVTAASAPAQVANPSLARRPAQQFAFATSQMTQRTGPGGGSYFAFADQVRAEAGEPVQPKHVETIFEVTPQDGTYLPPRGVVLRGATYRDRVGFQPLVLRGAILGLPAAPAQQSPSFTAPGWYPAVPLSLRRFADTPGVGPQVFAQEDASLIFYLGQYHPARRTERVYETVTVDTWYANAADVTPPTIASVSGSRVDGQLELVVRAADDSGVHEVVVAYTDNRGTWSSATLARDASRSGWSGRIPADAEALVQVVDGAGNVAYDDAAGRNHSATTLPPPPAPQARPIARLFLPLAISEHCAQSAQTFADVVLVVDLSTSMNERAPSGRTKLDAVLDAAGQMVARMKLTPDGAGRRDQVAVVGFNSRAWTEAPLTNNRALAQAALTALAEQTRTGSRLDLAFQKGAAVLGDERRAPGNAPVMVVLTDGQPSGTTDAEVLAAAAAAKASGIRVYAIGVGRVDAANPGLSLNADLLRAAASHPSMFYLEPDAEALGRIYGEIAGTIGCSAADFWGGR